LSLPFRTHKSIVHVQAYEPAEQQTVVELLDQDPMAAHEVQHLKQQRPQEFLSCYRWPSGLGSYPAETGTTTKSSVVVVIARP
jgi:hypothetical protein